MPCWGKPHTYCGHISAAKSTVNIYVPIYLHVYIFISTYGTYVSLVLRVPRATGKRKTGSLRSKVTHGWLISNKIGEIVLYFISCSSLQSANVQS